ncbi:TetR/AcrR family transcriptional regulator [Rhodococcus sp. O3]|uniref:TetR/AcrR family transcriptional regulator n=1 Tax=Rhodococcus sp. O3 TaxID=3404919 RepID=UPI003B681EB4
MNVVKSGRREMYAALTRDAVLEAARSLFVDRGFASTSVEDIAKLANVSKGAVYHHFSDKQTIFAQLVRDSLAEGLTTVVNAIADVTDPWERVERALRAYLKVYAEDRDARALLRQVVGVLGEERTCALDNEFVIPTIEALLVELDNAGELKPLPIEITTRLVFDLLCGAAKSLAGTEETESTSREMEAVILHMFSGLRRNPLPR